eukprot:11594618-Karenia_brevis.AAC.1
MSSATDNLGEWKQPVADGNCKLFCTPTTAEAFDGKQEGEDLCNGAPTTVNESLDASTNGMDAS